MSQLCVNNIVILEHFLKNKYTLMAFLSSSEFPKLISFTPFIKQDCI